MPPSDTLVTLPLEPYISVSDNAESYEEKDRGIFLQSSLKELLIALFNRLKKINSNDHISAVTEVLLHLPADIANDLPTQSYYGQQFESNKLFLYRTLGNLHLSDQNATHCYSIMDIPSDHFLGRELLIIWVSEALTVFLSATPEPDEQSAVPQEKRWKSVVLFSIDEIIERCETFHDLLNQTKQNIQNTQMDAVLDWLTETKSKLRLHSSKIPRIVSDGQTAS
ncbi:MAG: hypothetical protein P9M15_07515, partial [Candidatus Electryoneaceae bacterium]|nr:hypothetical protein [Candidatus Electryoneaceae bacterium]